MGMDSLDLLHTHGIENEMKLIMKRTTKKPTPVCEKNKKMPGSDWRVISPGPADGTVSTQAQTNTTMCKQTKMAKQKLRPRCEGRKI
jgi:hypothetical protein